MSEKRVNIRITASTSDFDKAIKKAQQQIEKLADTIDDMGKGKFGDNLEKQLEKVTDAAKDMQKQLEEMQESLDDMNKSKVDKLEKKLDDVSESAEDLNDTLEDTTDTLEDMNKAKVDKLEKQFKEAKEITEKFEDKLKDVIDSLKDMDDVDIDDVRKSFENIMDTTQDVKKRIDDLLNNFDKLEVQDLDKLRKEFEDIQTSIRGLSDDTRDVFDDLDKQLQEVIDELNYFDREIEDVDTDRFTQLEEKVRDLGKYINEANDFMQDFNRENNSLETGKIEDYANAMDKIDGANSKLDLNSNIKNKSNKGGGNNSSDRLSNAITELAGAEMVSSRVTSAIQDLEGSINKVADSMQNMGNLTAEEQVESYKDLVNTMIKTQEVMDEAAKKQEELTKEYDETNQTIEQYQTYIKQAREEIEYWTDEQIELENSFRRVSKSIKQYESDLKSAEKAVDSYNKKLEGIEQANQRQDSINDELESIQETIDTKLVTRLEKLAHYFNNFKDEAEDAAKAVRHIFDFDGEELSSEDWIEEFKKALGEFDTLASKDNDRVFLKVRNTVVDIYNELNKVKKLWEEFDDLDGLKLQLDRGLEGMEEAEKALNDLKTSDRAKQYEEECKELEKLDKQIRDVAKIRSEFMDLEQNDLKNPLRAYENDLKKSEEKLEELTEEMKKLQDIMDKGNGIANQSADEFNDQYKAYEKLSQRVKEYLEDESNAIVLREKVAKSFRDVADAMEKIYSGSSKHNNADLINKTLEESIKYFKELNLVSTDNIQRDLKRLGEIVEDKTEKIKRFKEANKEFGTDASKASYGIEKQGEALKDYADSVAFVINKTNVLQKAWGDISVGDVDHLQIRPRIELLDNYEKKLKSAADKIQKFYTETQGPMTQEQQTTLEDWKIWEKNAEKLKEYNKALEDYFTTIMDSGKNIDKRFLDELGKFDVTKFAKEFEKMGTTSVVLQKQFNANKIALQEWLQTEKEYREEAVKSAKVALDQATNNQKLAESYEERREATEKIAKAEEELAKAKESLKNFIPDASKEIQKLNEIAEGLRKIGMAAEDLGKEDIAKFDKSLASLLDRMDTFDNDLPKTFSDLKEDIKAVFADMDGLDFGSVFDGLKDIGAGLLDKIPGKAKIAAAAIAAIGKAMKEVADIGVNQFYKGMDTVQNALSGFINVAKDVGSEVKDAFENITDFNMDFSSLIEMPIDFESQMAKVSAIAGATKEEFKELEEEARRLGAETRYSATEVAEAMEYMGMAGWTVGQMIDKNEKGFSALESVLNLATVAQMDLGQASDFVTDGLTALGYEAEDAAHFVDILAAASTSSNTSVAQMQKAFTNCAPVAGTLNTSMEDLSIALGLMADKGVKGAKAGTALKNLMANLSAPTEKQLAFIKQFNLEGAQQAIVEGRLVDGLKQMQQALSGLDPKQKNAIITTIAGKEALSGVSALLNTTESDLTELEGAIRNCDGAAQEMAGTMDQTLKGHLKELASAMQETVLQVFDKTKEGIKDFTKQLTEFFHILNGFSDFGGFKGLEGALAYLENVSQGWGTAITNGLTQAIGAIDNFVNSASLDNLLDAGTNIINGIANGIRNAADNGTLQSAITTAIQKIGTWFSENLETVVEVGKIIIDAITKGIRENSDLIGDIIKQVTDMQIEIDEAIAYEKGLLFGENFFTFFAKGIETKVSEWGAVMSGFFDGLTTDFAKNAKMGTPTTSSKKKSNKKTSTSKKTVTDEVADQMNKGKVKTDKAASEIGKGISDNILKKLETMDAGDLKELNQEMKNLQNTVKSMSDGIGKSFGLIRESARTEIVGMTNIFRNQFVNMTNITRNQMVNVSNIIRNQAVNWANIIRNQVVNGRNAFTQQMMSMAAVARTQMVNVSNIIRNQALNWYNIINNQAKKARDAFTSQMISMAKVASTQMGKVSSSIRNAMKTSASASAMSYSVNRTVSVNYAGLSANALYAANNASTATLGNNMGALANSTSYAMSTGGGSMAGSSIGSNITLEIPVMLDGRELAKASAKYIDGEIKTINKRENRKRGAK